MVDVHHMLAESIELIKHFGLVIIVRIRIFHFMKLCMLSDGGMNSKEAISLSMSRSVQVNKQQTVIYFDYSDLARALFNDWVLLRC